MTAKFSSEMVKHREKLIITAERGVRIEIFGTANQRVPSERRVEADAIIQQSFAERHPGENYDYSLGLKRVAAILRPVIPPAAAHLHENQSSKMSSKDNPPKIRKFEVVWDYFMDC